MGKSKAQIASRFTEILLAVSFIEQWFYETESKKAISCIGYHVSTSDLYS